MRKNLRERRPVHGGSPTDHGKHSQGVHFGLAERRLRNLLLRRALLLLLRRGHRCVPGRVTTRLVVLLALVGHASASLIDRRHWGTLHQPLPERWVGGTERSLKGLAVRGEAVALVPSLSLGGQGLSCKDLASLHAATTIDAPACRGVVDE